MEEHKKAYLEYLKALNYSPETVRAYDEAIKRLQKWLGNKRVQDITEKEMRLYSISMKEEGLKPHSMSNYLLALKEFFRYLTRNFIILVSPAEDLEVPVIPRGLPEVLSEEEMFYILDSVKTDTPCEIRTRAALEILYSSGIRRSELTSLTLDRTDLENGCLAVIGKFDRERVVPVGETALEWLKTYLEEARPLFDKGLSDRLLLNSKGMPLTNAVLSLNIKKVRLETGLDFSCQKIRRSCATHLLKNGADILHIAQLLGHETLETLTRYLRIDVKDIKATHEKVF